MLERIMRAIRLEPAFYREVAATPSLMTESFVIVLVTAVLSSVGVLSNTDSGQGLFAFGLQVMNNLVFGWFLWSVVAYFVGSQFFGGHSSVEEMLRTLGYASAPRLLGLFGFIPCIGWVFSLAGFILSLAAGVVAIREAMEFDTSKALVTALVGLALFIMASIVIFVVLGGLLAPFSWLMR